MYEKLRDENRFEADGCNVKYRREHGLMSDWEKIQERLEEC